MKPTKSKIVVYDREMLDEQNFWVKILSERPDGSFPSADYARPAAFQTQRDTLSVTISQSSYERLNPVDQGQSIPGIRRPDSSSESLSL